MATNLALDDELIDAARELGCHKTKKAAVMAALEEYVQKRRIEQFLALAGTVEYDIDPMELRREEREREARRVAAAEAFWAEED